MGAGETKCPYRHKNFDNLYFSNKYNLQTKNFNLIFLYSMNKKGNKNARVEQLIKMLLSCEEEKGLIVKDPFDIFFFSIIS